MVIGVLSDTHGNVELMHNAVVLLDGLGATRYFHLGDNYGDCDALIAEGYQVDRVPGIYATEYIEHTVPRKLKIKVDGVRFVLAHSEHDITTFDLDEADVVCVGHTHVYEVRDDVDRILVNPGHLKGPDSKGQVPSCGIIEIDDRRGVVKVRVIMLDGYVVEECSKALDIDLPPAVTEFADSNTEEIVTERRSRDRRVGERRSKQEETQVRIEHERRRKERRQMVRRQRDRLEQMRLDIDGAENI